MEGSDRICYLRMKGNKRNLSIINVHSPTEENEEEEKEAFSEFLENRKRRHI